MALRTKRIAAVLLKLLKVLVVVACAIVLAVVATVVWTFEVKLHRWPIFVYGAPSTVQTGDRKSVV